MKKETKIIIIGAGITLLVLILAIFILYLITKDTPETKENNNNTNTIEEAIPEENDTTDNSATNTSTSNNNSSTSFSDNNSEITVTVYLFRGETCHFCENAIDFFEEIADDYPYLEIKAYEVWKNEQNRELMDAVATELNLEVSPSVPLIIIGETYARRGFSENVGQLIKEEIEKAYSNEDYTDVVENILNENNFDVTVEQIN